MDTEYRTSDIGIAAYLMAINIVLVKIEPGGRRSWFIFNHDARQFSERYWNDEAKVNPKAFQTAMRELKARLHGENS